MRKAQLFVLVALVVLWPSSAYAERSFWGWLEELSGPGPFRGTDIPITLLCDYGKGLGNCWRVHKEETVKRTLSFKIGRFTSDDKDPRFKDLPATDTDNRGTVTVVPVTVLYLFRQGPLDLGPGAGLWRVSGDGFPAFYKLALTPISASFSPFALIKNEARKGDTVRWAHVLRFELDTTFVPQGFKGSDFKNTRTKFDSGPEFLTRGVIVIDVGAIIWKQ